jgi:Dolichyl-phosphate-mannose-protein mannosyltransferase
MNQPVPTLVNSDPTHLMPAPRWLRPFWYGLCLTALGATAFWAERVVTEHSIEEQRALVPVSTVWGMHACLVLGLAAFAGLIVPLARFLGRRHVLTGLGMAVVGFLACGLAPRTTRIFYDEHIYMQIAQTIAHTGRAEYASYARAEYGDFTVLGAESNKQPNGHPYLLSWAFRLFGVSEDVGFATVRVFAGLTAAMLYFAIVLAPWKLPSGAPVAVALCFAFTPLVLWWGRTVAVEPTAAATVVAAFLAVCLHARWRDPVTGDGSPLTAALLAATAAFAAYFRPESLLVYPVAASLLLASDRRFLEDRATWAALALSLALVTPNLLHLWSMHTENWGATDGRRFDLAFLAKNLASNGGYFVQGKWFPLAGTVLALGGAIWLLLCHWRFCLCASLWFALSWGIFVLFYAGGYYYGASYRYAVISAAPVAVFSGIGAAAMFTALRRQPLLLGGIGAVIIMNWVAAMQFVPTLGRESNEARADVDFVREVASKLPTGALIISTDPCVWNVLGRNAAQMFSVESMVRTEMREMVRQYPGGIYLYWDYWMNCEPSYAKVWRQLIIDTHATVVDRRNAEAVKFAVFRLDTPYARGVFGGHSKIELRSIDVDDVVAEVLSGQPNPDANQHAQLAPNIPPPGTAVP